MKMTKFSFIFFTHSTGLGAVWKTCNVPAGSTVAVFGLGAVGLACIQVIREVEQLPLSPPHTATPTTSPPLPPPPHHPFSSTLSSTTSLTPSHPLSPPLTPSPTSLPPPSHNFLLLSLTHTPLTTSSPSLSPSPPLSSSQSLPLRLPRHVKPVESSR